MDAGGAEVVERATHRNAIRIRTGKKGGARGGADRLCNVETRETISFVRESIGIRCGNVFGAVASEIAVAEIVRKDENDVRTGFSRMKDKRTEADDRGRNDPDGKHGLEHI